MGSAHNYAADGTANGNPKEHAAMQPLVCSNHGALKATADNAADGKAEKAASSNRQQQAIRSDAANSAASNTIDGIAENTA